MKDAIEFLASVDVARLATDPRVVVAAGVVFVAALLMRWKVVALIIFGVGALITVARYAHLKEAALDTDIYIFVGGTFAVGCLLIYFLFIRGD